MIPLLRNSIERYSLTFQFQFCEAGFHTSPLSSNSERSLTDPSDSDLIQVGRLSSLKFTPSAEVRAAIKSQKGMADESGDSTRI